MKYKDFVIYTISHLESNNHYIGSTRNFKKRVFQHKKATRNRTKKIYHARLYRFIRDNGGWDHFEIRVLEYYPCNDFKDGRNIEFDYIDQMQPTLNLRI